MIPGLNTFLDRFENLFGKNYLTLGFIPALLFYGALAWLQEQHLAGLPNVFILELGESTEDDAARWVVIVVVVSISGYVLWALNTFFREFLEGQYLPDRIRNWLETQQQNSKDHLERKLKRVQLELGNYRQYCSLSLFDARDPGFEHELKDLQWINQLLDTPKSTEENYDVDKVDPVSGLAAKLRAAITRSKESLPDESELNVKTPPAYDTNGDNNFAELSVEQIKENFAGMQNDIKNRKRVPFLAAQELFDGIMKNKDSDELKSVRKSFSRVAKQAYDFVGSEYNRLWSERYFRYPDSVGDVGPTAMANMAAIHRTYAKERYGMEIDVLWPRIQKLVLADGAFSPLVDSTKMKLDFAVVMTVILIMFALTSVFIIATQATDFPGLLLPIVPGVALILSWLFYKIAIKSYRAFGEVLRSAIDLFRFDLITTLKLKVPSNSVEEKKLWDQVSAHTLLRSVRPLDYVKDGDSEIL